MSIIDVSLPGSEIDVSEPGSTFSLTSGTLQSTNSKIQNLDHLLKLEAQTFADTPATSRAEKLINYLDLFNGSAPYTIELAADAAISNLHDPHCLELVLKISTKWPDLDMNSYSTLVKMSEAFQSILATAPNLAQLCTLVEKASQMEFVSQHDILTLARCILTFVLEDHDSNRKRYVMKLLLSVYSSHVEMQGALVDLALQYLRKPLEYVRDQPVSKYSDKKVSPLVIVLLEFIHISGSLELARWDEAITYSRKKSFGQDCKDKIKMVDQIINAIVRSCMDLLDSETVAHFIDDTLSALSVPELCSSEALVRCLTIRLLFECKNHHNRYQLPPPRIFEVLAKIQRPLYNIFKAEGSGGVGQIIDFLIADGHNAAAIYLGTLECSVNTADWKDFHMRFTNPQTRVAAMAAKRWVQVLKTKPIGKMYEQTVDVMLLLSESGVPGPAYVEILKSLSVVVYEYPAFFQRVEKYLLLQLEAASSFVCDWTAHIISNYIAATKVEFSLVARTMVRVGGPGNLSYKKRCIKLLDQAYESNDKALQILAWKYLLILSDDPKASIAQLATSKLCEYIESSDVQMLCSIFQHILRLGPKYGSLIATILRNPLKKKAIHGFISHLLMSLEDAEPNYQQLKVAAIFISANGLYLPPTKVPLLVDLSISGRQNKENSLIILKMLQSALSTRPKIILSPKLVGEMYRKMVGMLPKYSEPEVECAGRILWELASLGRQEEKELRQLELKKIYSSSLAAIDATHSPQVLTHLCSIVSIGARVWVKSTDCVPKILSLVDVEDLRPMAIRVLCRVCTQSPNLFLEGPCFEFLQSSVFNNKDSQEWAQFMTVFLEFLELQDLNHVEQKLTADVLHGHDSSLVAESTIGGLFQTYYSSLEYCALYGKNKTASVAAAKLLCHGITTNKVDSSACTATVVTLSCSTNPEVSQFAHDCFGHLVERGHLAGFAKGLQAANQVSMHVFKSLWECLGDENIQVIISQLIQNLPSSTGFATTVYSGLTLAPLKSSHARFLEDLLDNQIYTYNGDARYEALMLVLRAVIQYKYAVEATPELDIPGARYVLDNVDPEDLRDRSFLDTLELLVSRKKHKLS